MVACIIAHPVDARSFEVVALVSLVVVPLGFVGLVLRKLAALDLLREVVQEPLLVVSVENR